MSALLVVEKSQGPKDDDDLWQLVLSTRMKLLHGITPGNMGTLADSGVGSIQTPVGLNFYVNGVEAVLLPSQSFLFGTFPDLAEGESQAFWLVSADAVGQELLAGAVVKTGAENPLHALPEIDDLTTRGIVGVYEVDGPVDFSEVLLSTVGTIHLGIPEGAFIGMDSRYYIDPMWIDVHS